MIGPRVRLAVLTALVALPAVAPSAQRAPAAKAPARRAQLQQRLADVVQRRLNLSGDQMARLRETTDRFATERQALVAQEREARRALRSAVASGDSSNDPEIGRRLDEIVRLQQRRTTILADEQHELARFLSPRQRADFLALQERALRTAQQLRQRKAAQPQP